MMPLDVWPTSTINPDGSRTVNVWGQLRFLPNGTSSQVYLQFRPQGAPDNGWQTIGPLAVNDPLGYYFTQQQESVPGVWRAIWISPNGRGGLASRQAQVSF
jgi:hypothetical protein